MSRGTVHVVPVLLAAMIPCGLMAASPPSLTLGGDAAWLDRELALSAPRPGSSGVAVVDRHPSLSGELELSLTVRLDRQGCLAGNCTGGALRLVIDRGDSQQGAVLTLHGSSGEAALPTLRWGGRDLELRGDAEAPDLGDGGEHTVSVRYARELLAVTIDERALLTAELAGAASSGRASVRLEAANEGGQATRFEVLRWRWSSAARVTTVEPLSAHGQGTLLVPKSYGIDYATQIHTLWSGQNPAVPTDLVCTTCHSEFSGDASQTYQVARARVNLAQPEQSILLRLPASGGSSMPPSTCFAAPAGPCYLLVLHWIQDGALFTPAGGGNPTLHPVSRCTLLDTRKPNGPTGGPRLSANKTRTIQIAGHCGVPAGVAGLRADVTTLAATAKGSLRLTATGSPLPAVQKSFGKGTKKFAAVQVPVAGDAFAARSTKTVNVLVEVTGYYQ